jgi:hypothetical protein
MFSKLLGSLVVLVTFAMIVSAADRVRISDPRTIGKWKGNEQAAIDIDKALDAIDDESVTAATAATVITPKPGATVTATGTVSVVYNYVTLTNVYDGVTNVFLACTNVPTATVTINVLNGAGLLTNATAVTTLTLTK